MLKIVIRKLQRNAAKKRPEVLSVVDLVDIKPQSKKDGISTVLMQSEYDNNRSFPLIISGDFSIICLTYIA